MLFVFKGKTQGMPKDNTLNQEILVVQLFSATFLGIVGFNKGVMDQSMYINRSNTSTIYTNNGEH